MQDRSDQFGNKLAGILIISIGIDNDVRAQPQASIQAGLECLGQPAVLRMTNNMIHAQGFGYRYRIIMAAVINNQRFQAVNARDTGRQPGQGIRQCLGFIKTGNLNN